MSRQPRPPLRDAFRALTNYNYRLFWLGQLASVSGTWMQRIAQAWLVLELTNSPQALGTVTAIQFLPILLFSLVGGVLADRFPKRQVVLGTQTVMLFQAVTLAVLTITGQIRVEHIYVLAAILGLANAIDNPTRQAFVAEMVGRDNLANAVALNSAQFNAARIIGPAIGGITIAAIGVGGCFLLNGASYLGVIGALLLMRPQDLMPVEPAPRQRIITQIGEGLRYALTTPDIALVALLMAAIGTFGYNFTLILPLIAQYVLDVGPLGFSTLVSAMGIGSLAAALTIAYRGKATRRGLLTGAIAFSVLLAGVALSPWWWLTTGLLLALGFASIVFSATANTRLQMVAPGHLRGRVMSIYALLFAGTTPIGSMILGTAAERIGVSLTVLGAAALCGLGVLGALLYLTRMRHQLMPEATASTLPATAPAPPAPRSIGGSAAN